MSISPISFGKKTRVAQCQIKDILQNKNVNATIYNFDCQDFSDIEEMKKISGNWMFKDDIISKMETVYHLKNYKKSSSSFYAMENNETKEIVGIAQTKDMYPDLVLDFLESSPDKRYKYAGKNMMAFLSGLALNSGYKRIYIPIPRRVAMDFYIKKCGFNTIHKESSLMLPKRKMKHFSKLV